MVYERDAKGKIIFPIKGNKKPMWKFVRLVARDDATDEDKLKSKDATRAYCMLCSSYLTYTLGNINPVSRHMKKFHPTEMGEAIAAAAAADTAAASTPAPKKVKADTSTPASAITDVTAEPIRKKQKTARGKIPRFIQTMEAEAAKVVDLLADAEEEKEQQQRDSEMGESFALNLGATSGSVEPFRILADPGFLDLCELVCLLRKLFKVPSKASHQGTNFKQLSHYVMGKVKQLIATDMDHCSATSDIWTSATMQSFLVVTLHYLTKDFQSHSMVLDMIPIERFYSFETIRNQLDETFEAFDIPSDRLTLMMRYNDPHVTQACNELGIQQFGSIGHGFHTALAPFLLIRKQVYEAEPKVVVLQNDKAGETHEEDIADYNLPDDNEVYSATSESTFRTIAKFRKVAMHINNSPSKTQQKFKNLCNMHRINRRGEIHFDVQPRWTSVYSMLTEMIDLQVPLRGFLNEIANENAGKSMFNQNRLELLSDEEWILAEGLILILHPVKKTTEVLVKSNHAALCMALPRLRQIRTFLESANGELFTQNGMSKTVRKFVAKYDVNPCFERVCTQLKDCCTIVLQSFLKDFSGLSPNILWVSLFHPSNRQMNFSPSQEEKEILTKFFTIEVMEMSGKMKSSTHATISDASQSVQDDDFFVESCHDRSPKRSATGSTIADGSSKDNGEEHHRQVVQAEIAEYMGEGTAVPESVDVLKWWHFNSLKYPNIAIAARKWLSVPAVSTAAERAFSDSGCAVQDARITNETIVHQALLKNNLPGISLSISELQKALTSKLPPRQVKSRKSIMTV